MRVILDWENAIVISSLVIERFDETKLLSKFIVEAIVSWGFQKAEKPKRPNEGGE